MMENKDAHRYDDIINLLHPTSSVHPRMSLYDRAAQFSPFAALTGHDAAIKETARLTERKMELDEDTKERLNKKLQAIQNNLSTNPPVAITYFVPDERKSGGAYVTYTGCVKRIDGYEHTIIMQDKTVIQIDQIVAIESELFLSMES